MIDNAVHPGSDYRDVDDAQTAGSSRMRHLDRALRAAVTVLERADIGRWRVRLPRTRCIAQVDLDDDWLTIAIPLRRLRANMSYQRLSATLLQNARMTGCPRIVGDGLGPKRKLIAEVHQDLLPWDCDDELAAIVTATFGCLRYGLGERRCKAHPQTAALSAADLAAALEEAGWPSQPADGDGIEVPMELAGDYVAASIGHAGCSSRLRVPLLEQELASAEYDCRRAIAVLMWLVAERVRTVKPVRARRALALEAWLPPLPASPAALGHACAALSVALQRFIAEAKLLAADERLARLYLAKLGFETAG